MGGIYNGMAIIAESRIFMTKQEVNLHDFIDSRQNNHISD